MLSEEILARSTTLYYAYRNMHIHIHPRHHFIPYQLRNVSIPVPQATIPEGEELLYDYDM